MKYLILFLTILSSLFLSGCKENKPCNLEIGPVSTREEAMTLLKSNQYSCQDSFKVSSPKFVREVFYYSCNKKQGFLLYKSVYNREYFFSKVSYEDWLACKEVTDCDSFIEKYISEKYLSYEIKEIVINDTFK